MSSILPTRRPARTTRATKDTENANARTRAFATTSRATAPTAASIAKAKADPAAGKRKREPLGDASAAVRAKGVTVAVKAAPAGKGDATKVRAPRQPLRTVAGPTTNAAPSAESVLAAAQELVAVAAAATAAHDENAMVVDEPLRKLAVRRSRNLKEVAPTRISGVRRHPSPRAALLRHPTEEDPEVVRIVKKRRTSSDAPEEEIEDVVEDSDAAMARIAAELEAHPEQEADPEGSQWDDLDAEDAEDPVMVSEYVVEIFNYLKMVEKTTMPNPNYMESQKELAWKMRGILTDWLIQVHVRFRLLPETLFLCVNIIDRFLTARVVSLAKLQLVGVTCMFIAAKFEEVMCPSVTEFLVCADSSYTEAEILKAERYVLKTLEWNLSFPNPVHYLRRISKADEYDVRVRTLAKYLLEIGCLEWRLIAAPPSLMAAAAIWLARLALGREEWTPNLAHYSSYPESALIPTANLMLNYILKPVKHESFFKKYAAKKFLKSSLYMQSWALDRWPEGSQVVLATELPALKAEIRVERHKEELRLEHELREQEAGEQLLTPADREYLGHGYEP